MATGKKKQGAPTKYDPKVHVPWGQSLARLGWSDDEIAAEFGVHVRTLYRWKAHDEFKQALKDGKSKADAKVVDSLYQRALGITVTETRKTKYKDSSGKETMRVEEITKQIPPDTTAMIYWLKNRQPELWRDVRKDSSNDEATAAEFLRAWRDDD